MVTPLHQRPGHTFQLNFREITMRIFRRVHPSGSQSTAANAERLVGFLAAAGTVGASLISFSALGQQQAPTSSETTAPELQEIVVTGSMIKRPTAETSEAVTVLSVSALKDMGITTVEGALQQLSAYQANGIQNQTAVGSFDGGISEANLRGLGGSRTLVLMDGQRLANNVTYGNTVDLNMIPLAAIDHIEVLREGASSLYGSDAIAGVVNFITKKNLTGGEINVDYNKPQHSGGSSQNIDATFGHGDLEADGYNVLVTGSFNRQQELTGFQRSSFANGYNPAGGLSSSNGLATWPGSYIDNNGNIFQTGYPACAGNPALVRLPAEGIGCGYLYSLAVDLVPRISTASGLIDFTKSLPGNNQISVQYFYSRNSLNSWGGPISYDYTMTPATNPTYFPTAANSTCVGGCSATPDLVDPILAIWTPPNNNRYNDYINSEQRILVTFSGQNAGWDYAVNGSYSQNTGALYLTGYPALTSLETPAGNLSPLINPFGPSGAAGNALINSAYVNGNIVDGTLSMYDVNSNVSHELGKISSDARATTFAFGVDARHEQLNYSSTGITPELESTTGFAPTAVAANRSSLAAFTELDLPLTKQLEVTISDREDYYDNGIGSTNNAKIAARYQPFSVVTFRGTASTGFRAPSLVDLYSPQVFGATSGKMVGPPCLTGNYTTVFSSVNCNSQGLSVTGGNPQLQPETSQNFDIGVIIEPIENLGISIDFYRINISNEIQTIESQTIYSNPTQFPNNYFLNSAGTLTPATLEAAQCPPPAYQKAPTCGYITSNVQNTGGIQTAGFDINPTYSAKTDYGNFKFSLDATYVTKFEFQEYTNGPIINEVGGFNQGNLPVIRYQHFATVDWTYSIFGAGISNHFTDHYTDEYTDASGQLRQVASYSIWNGYASVKPIPPLTLVLGIKNIADTQPPFSNQTASNFQTGFNPALSDPIGRTFYVNAKFTF
jgi:iron complex outermembrane recepter protein